MCSKMMFGLALVAAGSGVATAHAAPARSLPGFDHSAYEWLLGDWFSENGGSTIRQSMALDPNKAFVTYATYLGAPGEKERLHFEGLMVWNGSSKAFDYLFAVEPGSGSQERGTVRAEPDGSIIREVELTGADGAVSHFRQTFRRTGPQSAETSLVRKTAAGWEPNFPGSDRILMVRKPD
jgi:hypothetical protein